MVAFRGIRSSKFRHVYGVPARRDGCFENITITKNAHDSHFCAVNPKFVAVVTEVAGGGSFLVLPLHRPGRVSIYEGKVTGHRGPVLDVKWNPFNDNVIASCSDDCTIKLWYIPDEGIKSNLEEWIVDLRGHKRRVGSIEWHPTADNILLSAGFDYLIILWNISRGEAVNVIDCHPDIIYSMSFNRDGSKIATTCKDKRIRIIEPRSGKVIEEGRCHEGSKASKVVYLGDTGRLFTTGFSKSSDRQFAIWSEKNLASPLRMEHIDCSSGVLFPFYDYDTNVIYIAGKGDGNIRYYELVDTAPWCHYLSQFLSGSPQRGLGVMPKRGLDISKCEIFRFYKLHATRGLCEPLSMVVPRKSDQFQEDLYPDTPAPTPSLTADDWLIGKEGKPVLISMRTGMSVRTHKPVVYCAVPDLGSGDRYSRTKMGFLSTTVIPDYRPRQEIEGSQKEMKTTANEQIVQLTAGGKWNKQNSEDGIVLSDKYIEDVPATDEELRKTNKKQAKEIAQLKQLLTMREERIRQLEVQLKRLTSG